MERQLSYEACKTEAEEKINKFERNIMDNFKENKTLKKYIKTLKVWQLSVYRKCSLIYQGTFCKRN